MYMTLYVIHIIIRKLTIIVFVLVDHEILNIYQHYELFTLNLLCFIAVMYISAFMLHTGLVLVCYKTNQIPVRLQELTFHPQ